MVRVMSISGDVWTDRSYRGTKLLLFAGSKLVTLLRDNKPTIPWPNYWDFPGGGREGNESAVTCTLRETREEVGLSLTASDLIWARLYQRQNHFTWFFAARLPEEGAKDVRFGDEGQRWRMMTPQDYLTHPRGIPHFQSRLADFIATGDQRLGRCA